MDAKNILKGIYTAMNNFGVKQYVLVTFLSLGSLTLIKQTFFNKKEPFIPPPADAFETKKWQQKRPVYSEKKLKNTSFDKKKNLPSLKKTNKEKQLKPLPLPEKDHEVTILSKFLYNYRIRQGDVVKIEIISDEGGILNGVDLPKGSILNGKTFYDIPNARVRVILMTYETGDPQNPTAKIRGEIVSLDTQEPGLVAQELKNMPWDIAQQEGLDELLKGVSNKSWSSRKVGKLINNYVKNTRNNKEITLSSFDTFYIKELDEKSARKKF